MDATITDQDSDKVIDEYVAHWNSRIGESRPVPLLRKSHRDYTIACRHVTDDLIRQFVICQGDTNPLWREEAYAKASPWGRIIGPPLQIMSVASSVALPHAPIVKDWNLMHAGSLYQMERPLVPGDVIDAEDVWMGITERTKADRPHRTFILNGERRFRDASGRHVGKLCARVFATVPKAGSTPVAPAPAAERKRRRYTEAELKEIYDHYDDEIAGKLRRGGEPRYWEDVSEGDEIGQVLKGPVDVLDAASFIGSVGAGLGFADKWMLIKDELSHSPVDVETGAYHFSMTWHLDDNVARSMGQPYAMNFGALIEVNFSHALSNWAGDHAFVREIDNKLGAPMYLGDTLRIIGKVVKTYEQDGRGLVEVMLQGVNQDGIQMAQARSVIQLPHRGRPDEVVRDVFS